MITFENIKPNMFILIRNIPSNNIIIFKSDYNSYYETMYLVDKTFGNSFKLDESIYNEFILSNEVIDIQQYESELKINNPEYFI